MKRLLRAVDCHSMRSIRKRWRLKLVVIVIIACLYVASSFWSTSSRTQTNGRSADFTTQPPINRYIGVPNEMSYQNQRHPLFRHKPLVIWSSNFHPTPVVDIKQLLEPLGVRFIVKDLSSKYCQHFNTCASEQQQQQLRVISKDNVLTMNDYKTLIPEFYAAYRDDPEMQTVDAFLCCDPPGACELFEPFNKSLLIVATTRYHIGRSNAERWIELNQKIIDIASHKRNVVGANNRYDQEYIRYFTGIDARILPSLCVYTAAVYRPTRPGFLLAMRPREYKKSKKFPQYFIDKFTAACTLLGVDVQLNPIRKLYVNYEYKDLASHRGIVHLPYQASVMAMLEQYRMNVPLFLPSKRLLIDWNLEWFVLHERTESPPRPARYVRSPRRQSNVQPHHTQKDRPDPNSDFDVQAMTYWLQYADYYVLPHIVYFDSVEHLVKILDTITDQNLTAISQSMAEYNARSRDTVLDKWEEILLTIANYSTNHPH